MSTVDLRCPTDSRTLFARLRLKQAAIVDGNLIEVACTTCKKRERRAGLPVSLVLHRYNVLGEFVETETIGGSSTG